MDWWWLNVWIAAVQTMLSSPIKEKLIDSLYLIHDDFDLKILTYTSDVASDLLHEREELMDLPYVQLKLLHLVHGMSVSNEIPMMVMSAVVKVRSAKNNVEVELEVNLIQFKSKFNKNELIISKKYLDLPKIYLMN